MFYWSIVLIAVDWLVRIGLVMRVIHRRLSVSETLAWMWMILLFPVFGAILYLMFGEVLIGNRRKLYATRVFPELSSWLRDVQPRAVQNWAPDQIDQQSMATLVSRAVGMPPLPDNQLELLESGIETIDRMIDDVVNAERSAYLEFYIWEQGGFTGRLVSALADAAKRGIDCRVLVDYLASRRFLKSDDAKTLRDAGVKVESALKVGLFRWLFSRFDVRLHRKIVVIDESIGYAGSQNMVDPLIFKQSSKVGQWVDAMVRVEGEAAEALLATFLGDWQVERSEGMEQLRRAYEVTPIDQKRSAIVQVIPTGPTVNSEAARQIIVNMIFCARRQLILTTPYYVPDENLQMALVSAAQRGVDVTLVVPKKVDSRLVSWVSEPFQRDLVASGVRVMEFGGGLLHTKSITVDDRISLFGSLNLDLRSLRINFEITLAIYDQSFTNQLRRLQQSYITKSEERTESTERATLPWRFVRNAARLLAPLL